MREVVLEVPDGPLESGAPYWYWLGGRPAVDFVNTLRERWRRRVECLPQASDLAEWLVRARLLDRPAPVSAEVLSRARSLREAIDAAIVATVAKQRPAAEAIQEIDAWLPRARSVPRLRLGTDEAVLREEGEPDPVLRALGLLALDAASMLGTGERGRRRNWCSMRTCGNVAKARRHRDRAKQVGPGGSPSSSPHDLGTGQDHQGSVHRWSHAN